MESAVKLQTERVTGLRERLGAYIELEALRRLVPPTPRAIELIDIEGEE